MELLKETNERTWYLVKSWITKVGLPARIQQCVWKHKGLVNLHDHYTGYVQVPEKNKKPYYDSDTEVHGGITFEGTIDGAEGKWIGFDMAHYADENIENPLTYAEEECEKLARTIAEETPG